MIPDSPSGPRLPDLPPPLAVAATPDGVFVTAAPGPLPSVRVIAEDMNDSGVDAHTVGSVLLIVGLAGTLPWMLFWSWAPARGASPF